MTQNDLLNFVDLNLCEPTLYTGRLFISWNFRDTGSLCQVGVYPSTYTLWSIRFSGDYWLRAIFFQKTQKLVKKF